VNLFIAARVQSERRITPIEPNSEAPVDTDGQKAHAAPTLPVAASLNHPGSVLPGSQMREIVRSNLEKKRRWHSWTDFFRFVWLAAFGKDAEYLADA
jgi:hypothetical protein